MPKRRHEESKEERWQRKLKEYEIKLSRFNCVYSDENDEEIEVHLEENVNAVQIPPQVGDENVPIANADVILENVIEIEKPPDNITANTNLEVDPELLKALGEFETETAEWGENVQDDVAKRFQHILQHGIKNKEEKEVLLKKYLFPENMTYSKAPTLNPEIAAMLNESVRNRDKRLLNKQDQLGKALSALGTAMTSLLRKSPDIAIILRTLNDAGKLFSDAHYAETDTRRSLIIPLVDHSLIEPFKDTKRDGYLFGDKLGELVKNSRGIKKTGQYIQASASAPSTSGPNLNGRGPPSRARQQRANQPYFSRIGGQRHQYSSRAAGAVARRPWAPHHRQPNASRPPPPARRQPPAQAARSQPPPPLPPPYPT